MYVQDSIRSVPEPRAGIRSPNTQEHTQVPGKRKAKSRAEIAGDLGMGEHGDTILCLFINSLKRQTGRYLGHGQIYGKRHELRRSCRFMETELEHQLLWRVLEKAPERALTEKLVMCAPSWSWASVNSSVVLDSWRNLGCRK